MTKPKKAQAMTTWTVTRGLPLTSMSGTSGTTGVSISARCTPTANVRALGGRAGRPRLDRQPLAESSAFGREVVFPIGCAARS